MAQLRALFAPGAARVEVRNMNWKSTLMTALVAVIVVAVVSRVAAVRKLVTGA